MILIYKFIIVFTTYEICNIRSTELQNNYPMLYFYLSLK